MFGREELNYEAYCLEIMLMTDTVQSIMDTDVHTELLHRKDCWMKLFPPLKRMEIPLQVKEIHAYMGVLLVIINYWIRILGGLETLVCSERAKRNPFLDYRAL